MTSIICRVYVNLQELCSGVVTLQVFETDLVKDVLLKVCEKFHLAVTTDEAASKYALLLVGIPGIPKYFPPDLPLYGFLPPELTSTVT